MLGRRKWSMMQKDEMKGQTGRGEAEELTRKTKTKAPTAECGGECQ